MSKIPLHNLITKLIGKNIEEIDNEEEIKEIIEKLRENPDFEIKIKS